jgi:hypothetical protein
MYSVLLIGQSNAGGRGFPHEVPALENDRLYVQRNGKWRPMYTPVNPDRRTSGVCLAESFAWHFARHYNDDVGIIPCADGGSHLDQWQPGEPLYDHAIFQAKLAQRTGRIVGVLWHQGESDSKTGRWPYYEEKCTRVFESMRRDLGLGDDVPFLMGGLGEWLAEWTGPEIGTFYPEVNRAMQSMADKHSWIGFVPSTGLGCNPDHMHFSAAALRAFGYRYFEKFTAMSPLLPSGNAAAFDDKAGELEHL